MQKEFIHECMEVILGIAGVKFHFSYNKYVLKRNFFKLCEKSNILDTYFHD